MITEFTAGDTCNWRASFAGYSPADGWALQYVFVLGDQRQTVSAAADGDEFVVALGVVASAAFVAGIWRWQAILTRGDGATAERQTAGVGTVRVAPDFSATGYSGVSHVKRALDAIEAALERKATDDQLKYEIAGRSIERYSVPDLLKWRDKYRAEYKNEQQAEALANGQRVRRHVRVSF